MNERISRNSSRKLADGRNVWNGRENRNNGAVGQHRKLFLEPMIGSCRERVFIFSLMRAQLGRVVKLALFVF